MSVGERPSLREPAAIGPEMGEPTLIGGDDDSNPSPRTAPLDPRESRGQLPATIGRFAIVRELGSGGMGHVYVGRDEALQREVAIKVVRAERLSERNRARLRREAQALAQLAHPNVVPIFEVGEHEGQTYLAMELVVGVSVRRWLRHDTRTWSQILDVFVQAARGLAAAHARGLVHRDFKPENALVGDDPDRVFAVGRVRVVDFGLVLEGEASDIETTGDEPPGEPLLTLTHEVLGTPGYMAPEQLERRAIGPAADQFALAIALFEALTRTRPFAGSSAQEIASSVLAGVPMPLPPGPYPSALGPVLARALARDPAQRFPEMTALVDALEAIRARPRRRRLALAVWGAAIVLGVGAWWATREPIEATPPAEVIVPTVAIPVVQPTEIPEAIDPAAMLHGLPSEEQTSAREPFAEAVAAAARGEHDHAARAFGAAAAPYERSFAHGEDLARIELERAFAHRDAWLAGGATLDFVIAYELLLRSSYNHYAHPRPREIVGRAVVALHELRTRPGRALPADATLDPSRRHYLAYVDRHPAGTEIRRFEGELVCREPCTLAMARGTGEIFVFRRDGFHDAVSMLNPPTLDWRFEPMALARLGPGEAAVPFEMPR